MYMYDRFNRCVWTQQMENFLEITIMKLEISQGYLFQGF